MNKAFLIGNLTKDVDLRKTNAGKDVASCSIATNESYKDKDGNKQTVAQFHNLVVWGKQATVFAQYLKKGSKVFVAGKLQTRSWDDNGVKKYMTEIVVNEFEFLTPKSQSTGGDDYSQPSNSDNSSQPDAQVEDEINVEDIPF